MKESRASHTSNVGICENLSSTLRECFERPKEFREAKNYRLPDSSDPIVLCLPLFKSMVRNKCESELKEIEGTELYLR